MDRAARLLRLTEGQLWTVALGAAVTAVVVSLSVPAAMRAPGRHVAAGGPTATTVATPRSPAVPPATSDPGRDVQGNRPTADTPQAAVPPAAPEAVSRRDAASAADQETILEEGPDPSLHVAAAGWAAADPVNPLIAAPVPEGGLPVGTTSSRPEYVSYVQLTGTGTTLRLPLLDGDGSSVIVGPIRIAACPLSGEWRAEGGQSLDDAPPYDCVAPAEASIDGDVFEFDLGSLGDPTRVAGFALVALTDGPQTFRVTLDARGAAS